MIYLLKKQLTKFTLIKTLLFTLTKWHIDGQAVVINICDVKINKCNLIKASNGEIYSILSEISG